MKETCFTTARRTRHVSYKANPEAYWDLVGEDVLDDSGALEICHSIIEDFEKPRSFALSILSVLFASFILLEEVV